MYEVFFKKLNNVISFTEEEEEIIKGYLMPKKLRRKQYILQEGDVCKYSIFVEKGLLRSYTINEKGTEQIIQFALEGWFISDMYSFITGEVSTYNIDALEDAELVLMSNTGMEELRKRLPKFLEFSFLQIRSAFIAFEKRLSSIVNLTTEERYTQLITTYPDMGQRIPQHMIASYLGLTPETLSRARRQLTVRK